MEATDCRCYRCGGSGKEPDLCRLCNKTLSLPLMGVDEFRRPCALCNGRGRLTPDGVPGLEMAFRVDPREMLEAMRQFEIGTVHDGRRWVAGWNPPTTPISWVENEAPLFEGYTIEQAVARAVVGKLGGEGG